MEIKRKVLHMGKGTCCNLATNISGCWMPKTADLEPDRISTVAASVQPCPGVPWQLNKTMKRTKVCKNGIVGRVTLTVTEDIIMGGKSKESIEKLL